jgi:hypothetical protein
MTEREDVKWTIKNEKSTLLGSLVFFSHSKEMYRKRESTHDNSDSIHVIQNNFEPFDISQQFQIASQYLQKSKNFVFDDYAKENINETL